MKRLLSIFLVIFILLNISACDLTTDESSETSEFRVMSLYGPTSMGLIELIDNESDYTFDIVSSPDELAPALINEEVDLAAVPANLASVLYNRTEGEIQVLAINTLGAIYIVDRSDSIEEINDLRDKTLFASGKGASPEYALNFILENSGIDPLLDLQIEWKTEHAECVQALIEDENAVAMLPEPFITVAQSKVDDLKVALDLEEEWSKVQQNDSVMLTGVVVGRKSFIEENPILLEKFFEDYENSVDFVNSNYRDAADLIEKHGIFEAKVAQKAIPGAKIIFITGETMQVQLSGYLEVLYAQDPESIGGALPGDDFYYTQ